MSTVLITGASSGIGKASVETFAERGWNVVAAVRDPASVPDLAEREGVLVVPLDVQRPETIRARVEAGIAHFGGLDILLNNAGISLLGTFEELYPTRGREIFDVNVFGLMETTMAVLPHFRARRAGTIVNVGSLAGLFAFPLGTLYDATKYALEGFSESLAYELLPLGIHVKLIEPGLVRTRLTADFRHDAFPEAVIPDYAPFVERTLGMFHTLMAGEVPEARTVAERIFDAATDGTDRLRYLVTDEGPGMVEARRGMTDEAHVDQMRSMFLP